MPLQQLLLAMLLIQEVVVPVGGWGWTETAPLFDKNHPDKNPGPLSNRDFGRQPVHKAHEQLLTLAQQQVKPMAKHDAEDHHLGKKEQRVVAAAASGGGAPLKLVRGDAAGPCANGGDACTAEDAPEEWRHCREHTSGNRTHRLFSQLVRVREALESRLAGNLSHVVSYGTLLGLKRDHAMNKNEFDNDVTINEPKSNIDFGSLRKALWTRKLVLFHSGVTWRVCDHRAVSRANTTESPWMETKTYAPFTDIWMKDSVGAGLLEDDDAAGDWWVERVPLGSTHVFAPNQARSELILANYYSEEWRTASAPDCCWPACSNDC